MTDFTAEYQSSAAEPGWYPVEQRGGTDRAAVRYWDGAAWQGQVRPSNAAGTAPRDSLGLLALWLLIGGFAAEVLGLFSNVILSGFGMLSALVSLVVAIAGFARGRVQRYRAPASLGVIIANGSLLVLGVLLVIGFMYLLAHLHI